MERRQGQATGPAQGELRCVCLCGARGGLTMFKGKFRVTAGSRGGGQGENLGVGERERGEFDVRRAGGGEGWFTG